ncbi:radical SAM protein [Methylomonas methanica]|uniref:Radical SAM protein n=1 Tax=Methylomonas methanica TaxID=421 RepID=A0A177MJJ0_METMH|nr:radical SAM protein [Methylomonas methanica]OAI05977.1 radical SAM protein [Methylomonas methanica]
MKPILTTTNHNRNVAGLKYVYPVISRRAGGLSIGVNFNPNNACNWRCIYCQVPELQRGNAPEMDFALLEQELRFFLDYVQHGDFFEQFNVEIDQRVIKDIAISGNGEPTSLMDFDKAVHLIGEIATESGVFPASKFVLISNGSLIHQSTVQAGLAELARYNGELWFKLDSATEQGRKLINNTGQSQQKLLEHLKIATGLCPTKLQTCMLHYRQAWSDSEKQAYLALLQELRVSKIKLQEIMLYSVARQSFQSEADELERMDIEEMNAFATDIKALGYDVSVSH